MGIIILAAFIGVPLLEIAVFIQAGEILGLWPTLGLVVLTAFLGTWQLRAQGLATLARARAQVDQGALPARELFDGACLLVAGALLLTPGFVTDTAGFLLFLPPLRDALRHLLARHIQTRMDTHVFADGEEIRPNGRGEDGRGGPVIDGDYRDVTGRDKTGRDKPGQAPPLGAPQEPRGKLPQ